VRKKLITLGDKIQPYLFHVLLPHIYTRGRVLFSYLEYWMIDHLFTVTNFLREMIERCFIILEYVFVFMYVYIYLSVIIYVCVFKC